MNVGILILALFLAGASIFGIIMIGAANQQTVVDSFGQVQTNQTNETQGTITNTTAPILSAGVGLAFFIAVLLIFVAAFLVIKSVSWSPSGGRR